MGCASQLSQFSGQNSKSAPSSPQTQLQKPSPLHLTVLATSDIHANLRAYDYYQDRAVDHYGLSKVATLIKQERKNEPDSLLVDAGDLIQGTPLGELLSHSTLSLKANQKTSAQAVFRSMNLLHYTMATVGNHEFNFGLNFLLQGVSSANFPYVSSSLYWAPKNHEGMKEKPIFDVYKIIDVQKGERKLRVGFLGFTPPQIVDWDKDKLQGSVDARDILESAKSAISLVKKQGADVVIAVAHSGINALPYEKNMENSSYHLANIEGIDAVITGHSHLEFPGKKFEGQDKLGIDAVNGTIKGKPVVMPGFWGSHLGVLTLNLDYGPSGWKSTGGHSKLISVKGIPEDPAIVEAADDAHQATLKLMRTPVGNFSQPVQTYFSRVSDSAAVQLVNDAQTWLATKKLKATAYAKYPILSVSAPVKSGFGGEYTNIQSGDVSVKNVTELYIYPNTLKAVLLKRVEIKDWLEKSAENFNQMDQNTAGEFNLVNEKIPGYNFDIFSGVTYDIEIGKPIGQRIKNLSYQGKPVTSDALFVVVTNSYRAWGGGNFPHLNGSNIVLETSDEVRQVVMDYVRTSKVINTNYPPTWRLIVPSNPKVHFVFETSDQARSFVPPGFKFISADQGNQTAKFELIQK